MTLGSRPRAGVQYRRCCVWLTPWFLTGRKRDQKGNCQEPVTKRQIPLNCTGRDWQCGRIIPTARRTAGCHGPAARSVSCYPQLTW
jgi:hypothetical protein